MSGLTDHPAPEALRDEAVAWLVRVQSDAATGDDWAALTDWLEASEHHQAAFEEAELLAAEIYDRASEIAAGLPPPTADVVPFKPRRAAPRRWSVLTGMAAAAAMLVAAPVVWRSYEGVAVAYRTRPGETREVALADGTRIHMDAASTMTVRLGWRARRVQMGDAVATFDVAKDPGRPFLIAVGDQEVRVVGTQFNIRHYDKTVVVTVRRGIVEVRQPALGPQPLARLTVGQELRHVVGTAHSTRAQVNPDDAFAWTRGRLICDEQPLSEIVAYLNRRYPVPIRVSQEAAGRRFSGALELGDQGQLAQRLAAYLSLSMDRTEREITLR